MQVNINIDMALDLKMHGVIMKNCEFVADEQGAQEPKSKWKREIKVNKKAKKSWRQFFCNKLLSFQVLVWPIHSTDAYQRISIRRLYIWFQWFQLGHMRFHRVSDPSLLLYILTLFCCHKQLQRYYSSIASNKVILQNSGDYEIYNPLALSGP